MPVDCWCRRWSMVEALAEGSLNYETAQVFCTPKNTVYHNFFTFAVSLALVPSLKNNTNQLGLRIHHISNLTFYKTREYYVDVRFIIYSLAQLNLPAYSLLLLLIHSFVYD